MGRTRFWVWVGRFQPASFCWDECLGNQECSLRSSGRIWSNRFGFVLCLGAGAASRGPRRDTGVASPLPLPFAAASQTPRPHLPRPLELLVGASEGGDGLRDG